ncbi:LexA family protein [Parabacteroides distasonis]|uniref:LexA family protein n=1 Tax=Parabacteroides distasonis TaxID=823 RepID=UPI00232E1ED9|nr:S24 family peptidase [Parabacteroides distasonis]MDB9151844.1 S24 family peptidase [Parabacteroides distasonis]MDB9155905.1 S24 family peptidase [Parabacteroides distasonis]MDB9164819.1 S24 family peptidase [Parabacteroides distasonis]MDB9169455.1 S24 family peptidase [Parabacteroides distasonis]MDB9194065.1 S24 family peptidase [Parabacteroides distasonis]
MNSRDGDTVVAYVDGEFTLKYIKIERDIVWLMPANGIYPPIKITEENDFMVWGVVTYSIKKHRRRI